MPRSSPIANRRLEPKSFLECLFRVQCHKAHKIYSEIGCDHPGSDLRGKIFYQIKVITTEGIFHSDLNNLLRLTPRSSDARVARGEEHAEACRISSYLQTLSNRGYKPLVAIQMALSGQLYADGGE